MTDSLVGKRATVMGLGTRGGGVGVARYLVAAGALVTVTDGKPPAALAAALAELDGLPVRYVLGRHQEADFMPAGADLVVRNPGVPRRAPLLELARRHGLPVEMEMTLFWRACPAPIVGVTGTKGKTTVATLCAELLRAGDRRTVLAGNMGVSALDQLPRIGADTPVVLELSSWQLEGLIEHRLAPRIAVLTLIAEDHLNTYDGFADYAATKRGIARHQGPGDVLVVNADDPEAWRAAAETGARVVPFGLADRGGDGIWWRDGRLLWRRGGDETVIDLPANPALAGAHNVANALAAVAAALERGASAVAVGAGLGAYRGVRDRLEPVAEVGGVAFINDTTATAPVAVAAALGSLAGRCVHLLAGGADKGLDPAPLAAAAAQAHAVYLLAGSATPVLTAALGAVGVAPRGPFGDMEAAVGAAFAAAAPGDVVLLSPGCASFGLFRDEFERGERFRQAVRSLERRRSGGAGSPGSESPGSEGRPGSERPCSGRLGIGVERPGIGVERPGIEMPGSTHEVPPGLRRGRRGLAWAGNNGLLRPQSRRDFVGSARHFNAGSFDADAGPAAAPAGSAAPAAPAAPAETPAPAGAAGYAGSDGDRDDFMPGSAGGGHVGAAGAAGQVAEPVVLPPPPARVHFVGIGGIGMSGLARILRAWGYVVSGSDEAASPLTAALAAEGVAVTIGHGATAEAARADLVVATAAARPDNPELAAARAARVPVIKRAALLGLLANARRCVAVAGSHGKSTTSGMLVVALRALGAEPSYAIGAVLGATGSNAAPGAGEAMVVEADEYDYSFLHLTPDLAVVTNVEFDHPDLFRDQDDYDAAFARFVANLRPEGVLVIAADDPGCLRLRARADFVAPGRLITFGQTPRADWQLTEDAAGWRIIGAGGGEVPLALKVPGLHNARNATAALVALVALGQAPAAAAAALASFTGVGRRFEAKGEAAGVTVIDDYAHHPSEIRATLRAARECFPGRRLWAVFQPHTFSRLKALLADFGAAFAAADRVMILDVYAARETDDLGVGAADLLALLPADALAAPDPEAAAARLAALVRAGDVVVTLGAGSVTETGPRLLEALVRPSPPLPPSPSQGRGGESPSPGLGGGVGEGAALPPHLKLLRDSPLSLHTTWRVGGPADLVVRAPTPADLRAAVAWGVGEGLPVTVIGGGSNLLVGDGGIRGLVILARTPGERAAGLLTVEDLGDVVRLRVAAQAPLSWTGRTAAERGWAGLDWGVGLPGTIGGATVNNAGAHGIELKDHLEAVVVLDNSGRVEEKPAAWLAAAYRQTILKAAPRPRPYTVLEAVMRLPKGDPAALVRLADEHAEFRKQTQPTGACAGSAFANPADDFAGRLLEEAGLKGFRVGGAAFSAKHSNWIVNDRKATAADVRTLIAIARERVRARFGIELRQEIEEIGEW